MAKPSREASQHVLPTGPGLAQRGGLPAAVQGHHRSWEGNNLLPHHHSILWRPPSRSPVRTLALLGFMGGVRLYQTCSVVPPALPSRSAPFQNSQNKLRRRLLKHSGGKDGSEPPRQRPRRCPGTFGFFTTPGY